MAGGLDAEEERNAAVEDEGLRHASAGVRRAILRGNWVHRFFELYDFKRAAAPDWDSLFDEFFMPEREREKARAELKSIMAKFGKLPIADELADAQSLRRELPFQLNVGGVIVNGTIDVLVDGGIVLDYKTGRSDGKRRARYEWQLLLYTAALRALTGSAPKRACLYYVDEAKVEYINLDDAQMDSALKQAEETIRRLQYPGE